MSRFPTVAAALILLAAPAIAQGEPPHTLGGCGGAMTGYDGRQYNCEADRRPACDPDGQRCRRLESVACGGQRDEPF